jgi:hypothetical protein
MMEAVRRNRRLLSEIERSLTRTPGINRAAASNGRAPIAKECTRYEHTILDAHIKLGEAKKIQKAKGGRPSKTGNSESTGFPTLKEQRLTRLIALQRGD